MGQERFSSLALLNIECDLTAALVPEDLVLMYASMQWVSTFKALTLNFNK